VTCCGRLVEITGQEDREPIFLCTECGRQGPAREFPDPVEPAPAPLTRIERARFALAQWLVRLAERVAPK
jgi:hypothetical protein